MWLHILKYINFCHDYFYWVFYGDLTNAITFIWCNEYFNTNF